MTRVQKQPLLAPLRRYVYLHDGNTEVGVDEGRGPACLDRAELWKRTLCQFCVCVVCLQEGAVLATQIPKSRKKTLQILVILDLKDRVKTKI